MSMYNNILKLIENPDPYKNRKYPSGQASGLYFLINYDTYQT